MHIAWKEVMVRGDSLLSFRNPANVQLTVPAGGYTLKGKMCLFHEGTGRESLIAVKYNCMPNLKLDTGSKGPT